MIKKILLLTILFSPLMGVGQLLIGSTVHSNVVNKVHVAYTLGEPVVGTLGSKPVVTQGFLQPTRLQINSLEEGVGFISRIRVYPNPTQDKIILGDAPDCTVEMVNLQGYIVYRASYSGPFSITHFPSGNYVLNIYNHKDSKIQSSSIIKY